MSSDAGSQQPTTGNNENSQGPKSITSFGSSVINKSTKKFAPKIVQRRRPGASQAAQPTHTASERSSVERQAGTPQPSVTQVTESTQKASQPNTTEPFPILSENEPLSQDAAATGSAAVLASSSNISIATLAGVAAIFPLPTQPTPTIARNLSQDNVDISRETSNTASLSQQDSEETTPERSSKRRRIVPPQEAPASILPRPVEQPIRPPAPLHTTSSAVASVIFSTSTIPTPVVAAPSPHTITALISDSEASGSKQPSKKKKRILPWKATGTQGTVEADSQADSETGDQAEDQVGDHAGEQAGYQAVHQEGDQTVRQEWNEAGDQEGHRAEDQALPRPSAKARGKRKTTFRTALVETAQEPTEDAPSTVTKKPRKTRKDKGTTRKRKEPTTQGKQDDHQDAAERPGPKPNKAKRKRAPATESDAEADTAADNRDGEQELSEPRPKGQKGRQRATTPENAESIQVEPKTLTMGNLALRDPRIGKISTRELAMRDIDWTEVIRRRREQQENFSKAGNTPAEDGANQTPGAANEERAETQPTRGPQLRMIDGQIVLENDSLIVDRRAEATRDEDILEAVEEDDLTANINMATWVLAGRRDPAERFPIRSGSRWTASMTDAFYDALRIFGTDFQMISTLFVGKTRRRIKAKFVREERQDPERVKAALLGQRPALDFKRYCELSGREVESFKDPRELERELKEKEELEKIEIEKSRNEYEEMKRQKQFAGAEDSDEGVGGVGDSAKENRGKGKKRRRERRGKFHGVGGEEAEILGTIED
ncbi:hypothetical protein K432DRAFT_436618 [Lepidopterella palustris CBS 459.81]|uniref:Transcription factor TFIIIB component B'' Myb domain-containing protein n=1 Tax=Lepidopterella palustris CBS 459.81 TaxID=1314670 RepID=A0A8E2JCD9_9PEZI|nr:hypothetical protein K432DRAFT_436618 [Lepidopterella palustris CBS 459.81]